MSELYYRAHVFCCLNERPEGHVRGSCARRGAAPVRDYLKARIKELGLDKEIRINQAGCLDRCEDGPALVIYPEGVWYRPTNIAEAEEIIQTHLIGGGRVDRLMLPNTRV